MSSVAANPRQHNHVLRAWLLAVAALMVVTLLVGGTTRLTESGLSIVEWKPVTGVLPPLDEASWQAEFDKYKTIPQYRERNRGMTLDEFKTIYWWEWSHRLLARLAGAAFLLPFLWFLWRGWVEPPLRARLWAIFGLGGALGMVGWWMVASGLVDRVSVAPYRLGFHLTLACVVYAAILWTAQGLCARDPQFVPPRIRASAIGLLMLVLVQIYLGALVAGLRAGLAYNTWPLIDGAFVPEASRLFLIEPAWRNFFENVLTVQFDHRMVAYLLLLCALLHAADAVRAVKRGPAVAGALAFAVAVTLQAALGIVALIYQAPLALALMHQTMAIAVLTIAVLHLERLGRRQVAARIQEPAALPSSPRA
jgi:cytochrome c oxidase assembly protein subunit 15